MKPSCFLVLLLGVFLQACTSSTTPPAIQIFTSTAVVMTSPSETYTLIPSPTLTENPPLTETPASPTTTLTFVRDWTAIPSSTIAATWQPTGESPGVRISGTVETPSGAGLEGVKIYYAFSAYPEAGLSTTNSDGYYEGFIYIPSDETLRVWAEYPGYSFKPGSGNKTWLNGEFAWRHYSGYENTRLNFTGTSE
jgi:hypothetical protein